MVKEFSTVTELETIIEHNKKDCVVVGGALKAIRELELYKEEHRSFTDYCKNRWNFSRTKVHRWITAFDIHDELATFGNKIAVPTSESQYRELSTIVNSDLRIRVLRHIKNAGLKLTATSIKETASLFDTQTGNPKKPLEYIRITKGDIDTVFLQSLPIVANPKMEGFFARIALTLEQGGSMVMALYPKEKTD